MTATARPLPFPLPPGYVADPLPFPEESSPVPRRIAVALLVEVDDDAPASLFANLGRLRLGHADGTVLGRIVVAELHDDPAAVFPDDVLDEAGR